MREIITLQVGQCGNQIGNSFWRRLRSEHKIGEDGYSAGGSNIDDRADVFFYQTNDSRYVPRAILVDLEPRVIDSIMNGFFNEENVFVGSEGCGAGNNWAHGYFSDEAVKTSVVDHVRRESESCDYLEAFFLLHSVAGGTGSGLGALLVENIREIYPKSIIQAFSIFPNNSEVSDVVVQPYNTILSLEKLYKNCDSIIVMENGALGKIALDTLRVKVLNYDMINSFISTVIATSTSTIRFPVYLYSNYATILSATVPHDDLKFVIPSYSPFLNPDRRITRKLTVDEVVRRTYSNRSLMATCGSSGVHSYVSVLSILNNVDSVEEVQKSVAKCGTLNFVPWMPSIPHVVVGRGFEESTSCLTLANYTGISTLLEKILAQFDVLKQRNAYVEGYRRYSEDISFFESAREAMRVAVDSYKSSELTTFKY